MLPSAHSESERGLGAVRGPSLPSPAPDDALVAVLAALEAAATRTCLRTHGVESSGAALRERARRWATAALRSAAPRVALALGRDADHVAALVGAWWAGKCAVLLDLDSPAERLAAMVRRCGVTTIFAEARPAWAPEDATVVLPSDVDTLEPTAAPPRAGATAYVIFTSGSTGEPKGVEVGHAALARKLVGLVATSSFEPGVRVVAHHSTAADVSLMEYLAPLVGGAEVYFAAGDERKIPEGLRPVLDAFRPHRLFISPTGLRLLLSSGWLPPADLLLDVGGEKLDVELASRVVGRSYRFVNGYGPTEACIKCFEFAIARPLEGLDAESVPVGRPLHEVVAWVLDDDRRPVARGAVGQLAIGGPHLAEGYVDLPAATAARFVEIEAAPGRARVYLTGDLVRWTSHDQLEFLGRADDQVKLHGTRIELGEISSVVARTPGVVDATCEVVDETIVCYVASPGAPDAVERAARDAAERHLPAKMRPRGYLVVREWPLTASGKRDLRALRARYRAHGEGRGLDETLAGLLGVSSIDDDAYLDGLGVDSLVRLALHAQLKARGLDVPFGDVYRCRTLADLRALVRAGEPRADGARTRAAERPFADGDAIPQGAAFELFVTRLNYPSRYGLDSMRCTLDRRVDEGALRAALGRLARSAPALRARVRGVDHGLRWRLGSEPPPLTFRVASSGGLEDALADVVGSEVARGVDPFTQPLVRAIAVLAGERTGLALVYHALLLDHVSARAALNGWVEALAGEVPEHPWPSGDGLDAPPTRELVTMLESMGRVDPLPMMTVPEVFAAGRGLALVATVARIVRGLVVAGKHAPTSRKFEEANAGLKGKVASRVDLRSTVASVAPTAVALQLDPEEVAALEARASRLGVSAHAVLLGAFSKSVAAWLGTDRVHAAIIVHRGQDAGERAIGLTSTSVPTRCAPEDRSLDAFARAASSCLRVALENRNASPRAYLEYLSGPPPWSQFAFSALTRGTGRDVAGVEVLEATSNASGLPRLTCHPGHRLELLYDAGRFDTPTFRDLLEGVRRNLREPAPEGAR